MRNLDATAGNSEASGLTRRDALRAGGAGLAALMTPALLEACGSQKTAAKLSGPVISGQSLAPTTLDPHTASTLGALTTLAYVYEGLYGKSPNPPYGIMPQLAAGDPEQSGTKARITLRQGARFHDGSPVTAADVEASFKRILDPKTASFLAGYLSMVKSVKADGTNAVIVELHFPTTLLKDRLGLVKIVPVKLAQSKPGAPVFDSKPVGSGPYQVTSISRNLQSVRLSRYAGYNGQVKVALAKVGSDVITDDQARVAALQTKRLQAMIDPPFSAMDRLDKQPGLEAAGKLSFQQSILLFNNKKHPFTDKRVRQAIFHAINRNVITKSVFFGLAEPATSYLPKSNPDYKMPASTPSYDPAKARALLARAGVPHLKFQLNVSNLGWLSPQAPLIQSQLKDVGVDVSIRQGETESLVKYVTDGSFDAWLTVTDPSAFGNSDGEFLIQWVYGVLAGFMYWTSPSSKQMASLIDRSLKSTSRAEVKQLVGQMQDLAAEEVPAFPLHHRYALAAWNSGLDMTIDPVYGVNLLEAKPA
jgi:peptide/nickel transport system substrate-binding protein